MDGIACKYIIQDFHHLYFCDRNSISALACVLYSQWRSFPRFEIRAAQEIAEGDRFKLEMIREISGYPSHDIMLDPIMNIVKYRKNIQDFCNK